jgi:Protein of unknown function (DUF3276).
MYRDDYDSRYDSRDAEDVYSKPVRAGKRTYFFDVKATKGRKDFYLTITESKRRTNPDGSFNYDKHKIFLYKEDFEKFSEGLEDAVAFIRARLAQAGPREGGAEEGPGKSFTDVNFDEF